MNSLPWYQEGETDQKIAEWIHYPECWDTCAYPTLASALWEMCHTAKRCPTCNELQGHAFLEELERLRENEESSCDVKSEGNDGN